MTMTDDERAQRIAKLRERSPTKLGARAAVDAGPDAVPAKPNARPAPSGARAPRVVVAWCVSIALVVTATVATVRRYQSATKVAAADPTGMVWIPAGQYLVGSVTPSVGDLRARWMQLPGFAIDRRPVSEPELTLFVQMNVESRAGAGWKPSTPATSTVRSARNVPYSLAREYCAARHGQLPTEAQWDIAARGRDGRVYPWGNQPWSKRVQDVSPFGVRETVVGGTEWLGDPILAVPAGSVVVRGRSTPTAAVQRINYRRVVNPNDARVQRYAGFRCAAAVVASAPAPALAP